MRLLRRSMWRDMRARGAQFAAVGVTMFLGVALFGASFDAFQNLTASYQSLYRSLAFADLVATAGDPATIDAVAAAGGAVPGVDAVTTRPVAEVPARFGDHDQAVRVVGLPPDGRPAVDGVLVLRGSGLDPTLDDQVLVEQHLAGARGSQAGDRLEVLAADGWQTLTVAGVVASPEYLWPARSRQAVLVPFDAWGVLFAPASVVEALPSHAVHREALFRLADDAPDGVLERLEAAVLDAGAVSSQRQADQPSHAALQEDVNGFGELSLAFPVLFLLAGALAMSVLLGRMIASQRAQIGTLLANGFSRGAILRHYLLFGVLVGLGGSAAGAVAGALLASTITGLYTAAIAVPITVVEVRPLTVAAGLAMGPAAGALAAWLPARRAAGTPPAEAMRGDRPAGPGGRSLVERLVPPARRLPTRWRVALRGIGRNPRRAGATVLGIALATILVFAAWGMVDTVQVLLERQFRDVSRQDATVLLARPLRHEAVAAALAVPGVAAAEPQLEVPAAIEHRGARYATTIVGLGAGTTMHRFRAPGGDTVPLPADGLLLGIALRDRLDVEPGDTVTVLTGDGPPERLVVGGFVDEPFGTYAYASLATADTLAGDAAGASVSALVRYAEGDDRVAAARRLAGLPEVAAVVDSRGLYDLAQRFMGLFYAFVGLMLGLGAVMAFALIYTTMTANVAERATELAALRALGMSRGTIARLVTAENLLLTVLGLVPGLVAGYLLAAVFMASFSSDLFSFDLEVRPTTFLLVGAAILAVGAVSQVPALRSVGRMNLGRIVRERST